MLFIKYISDKYGDSKDFAPPVVIPKGASFVASHAALVTSAICETGATPNDFRN